MRTLFYTILLISLPAISLSQKNKPAVVKQKTIAVEKDKVFQKVESDAGPADPAAWNKYLQKNTQLSDSLAQQIPKGTYKVTVKFIIDKDGYIGQVQAMSDPGFGLAEKAVRIIRNYNIAWRPASQCGRTVKSYRQQAIVFAIAD